MAAPNANCTVRLVKDRSDHRAYAASVFCRPFFCRCFTACLLAKAKDRDAPGTIFPNVAKLSCVDVLMRREIFVRLVIDW
jgi:hypothetical protein